MDDTLNNFFNEIDEIAPPKTSQEGCGWQECYDETTGYAYYWNTVTDTVTWQVPTEYKLWKLQTSGGDLKKSSVLCVPPKIPPLFPSATAELPRKVKIYNIQEDSQNVALKESKSVLGKEDDVNIYDCEIKSILRKSQASEQEKVSRICSYGDASESENEIENISVKGKNVLGSGCSYTDTDKLNCNSNSAIGNTSSSESEEEDDTDILVKLHDRAKVLKELGGDLPPSVQKLVEQNGNPISKKALTGFSLVAGYGNSDDEDDCKAKNPVFPSIQQEQTSHSTLFPIAKSVDIKQFSEADKTVSKDTETIIEAKVFQRKRRIALEFDVASRNAKCSSESHTVRQGLGFKSELINENIETKVEVKDVYPGFKSGGLMFLKSDILKPTETKEHVKDESRNKPVVDDSIADDHLLQDINVIQKTLNEKLLFLSEGRQPATPVQVMIIQMQTLDEALKSGGLKANYHHKWLKETCSELVKLEQDAAPIGWILQWDRLNKCYYYRNRHTGESQWEYPQPDIIGGDEAMDICTTPPPSIGELLPVVVPAINDVSSPAEPPPPPKIKEQSPTPPPPPKISTGVKKKKRSVQLANITLLPNEVEVPLPPLPSKNINDHDEPLPPGVESTEIVAFRPEPPPPSIEITKSTSSTDDTLGTALNSFYSDLAAMETPFTDTPDIIHKNEILKLLEANSIQDEPVKKKKKTAKVKLVQGLAMKKKGVSKLVEKWKNVQKDFD